MTERRHESEDLEDYEVLDSSDTLTGPPGDDPLDRGVATPERWSAPIRSGGTADEQEQGESLDAEDVRHYLLREKPTVAMAIFAKEIYTGSFTTDLFAADETTYFDDADQFLTLQKHDH